MVAFLDERLPERFWIKVQPCPMSGCWIWCGHSNGKDHPVFVHESRNLSARRYAFTALVSAVPSGDSLLAKCATGCCCNPAHMRLAKASKAERDKKRPYRLEWTAKNRQRLRSYFRKRLYGITDERFEEMLTSQDDACAICRVAFNGTDRNRKPYVDHDHSTGVIRGLLCVRCNSGLGHFLDSPDSLIAAAAYLRTSGPA
jgi:hypothetical protein